MRSSEIVEFLAGLNIRIEDGSNTRIEADHLSLILNRFAPGTTFTEDVPTPEPQADVEPDVAKEEMPTSQNGDLEPVSSAEESFESKTEFVPEVIKAPKVELQGLKVLGKIELPEKKKKETLTETSNQTDEPKQEQRPRQMNKHRTENRSRKNPVVLQRERQEKQAEEEKRKQAELEKERRTKNYYSRVKHSVPTKAAKIHEEPVTHIDEVDLTEKPRTLWGKFVKWLTSY